MSAPLKESGFPEKIYGYANAFYILKDFLSSLKEVQNRAF